jgi:hypothetical protein
MIELSAELGKYTIDCRELCHYANFDFETRLDDIPPELAELAGINLADYIEPEFAPDLRVEKGFVPLKNTKFQAQLVIEGENNHISLGTVMFKKVVVAVKKISEQYVAILRLSFGDVTCSERLISWLNMSGVSSIRSSSLLFQNPKKVITFKLKLNKVQMDLPFGGERTRDDVME